MKSICEGRELPAYEAAAEFIAKTAGELEELLPNLGRDKGSLSTLKKLEMPGSRHNRNCPVCWS